MFFNKFKKLAKDADIKLVTSETTDSSIYEAEGKSGLYKLKFSANTYLWSEGLRIVVLSKSPELSDIDATDCKKLCEALVTEHGRRVEAKHRAIARKSKAAINNLLKGKPNTSVSNLKDL